MPKTQPGLGYCIKFVAFNLLRPIFWLIATLTNFEGRRKKAFEPTGPNTELEAKVRRELAFLFDSHQAVVVRNDCYGRILGNSIVKVLAGNLLISVVLDRQFGEDIYLQLEPKDDPSAVLPLETVLHRLHQLAPTRSYANLHEGAELMKKFYSFLNEAYSEGNYLRTSAKLFPHF